ncbi:hypothetical protein FH972_009103 [Carpinus fangiana]|uniref:RNase H type-1 domain-containing protein n=1 Tax=Carpinus fangiana TaxID=176857 RepID=A0A5N6R0U3_9ROSI|nr:hypothetical protein FH972_009103 [Carpinus fangiana]
MNCLWQVSSYTAAIVRRTSHFVARSSLYGCANSSWKINFEYTGLKAIYLEPVLARFHVRCYSSRKGSKSKSPLRKLDSDPVMEQEKDAFFVVRKGDIVGVYKSLNDCQAQVGSSVCDPPVSVYKGYSLPKDTEEYLIAHGLKNAVYTINAADLKEDLFGSLMPCLFQDPASCRGETSSKDASKKRSQEVRESEIAEVVGSASISTDPLRKHVKLDHSAVVEAPSAVCQSCILEFDGASKGNPGQAGAGAVLRADDGSLVQGLWQVKNQNMADLFEEAKKLTKKFLSFKINHVLRELNSEADAQANLAVSLAGAAADVPDVNLVYSDAAASLAVKPAIPTILQPRVVVYDGVCHLCHRGVKWVIKADKHRKIKFCCLQSKTAEPYLTLCGLDREDVLRRFLFVEGPGLYHQASTAALRVLSYLPLPYSALSTLLVVPTPLRDAVYDHVAKRRYDWFGKSEDCLVLQEKELLERFIDREEMMDQSKSDL